MPFYFRKECPLNSGYLRKNRPEKPDGRRAVLRSQVLELHGISHGSAGARSIATMATRMWCGDVTYIWTGKRWAYLAVVLDLFARKPVGWAMSFSPDSRLTMKALEMAWETRGKPVGVMFQAIKAVIIRAGSSGSYCGDTGSGRV
ncbi:transposase [Escherichia coli]|nr:transposase [Escherichia coli]